MNITTLLLCLNAGISVILAAVAFQRRSVPGSFPLFFLMLGAALWSLSYALELYSGDSHIQLLLVKIQYIGIVFIPVAAFFISVSYKTQRKIKNPWKVLLVCIMPVLTLFVLWTNEFHSLFYSDVFGSEESITFFRAYGPAFWLHILYAYLLLSMSVFNLIISYKKLPDIFRKQTTVMLIASLIPWIINLVYLSKLVHPAVDPTPFGLTASGITLSIGLFYLNLFQPIPIAENHIVNILKDIVLILTPQHHILKLNSAAETAFKLKTDQVLGLPLQEISKDIFNVIQSTNAFDSEECNIVLNKDNVPHYYQCHVSPLYNKKNKLIAKIILLSDISHIKKTELALKKLNQELESRINERTKELAWANNSLQQQITQKELLLTELNHRVKNNLSIIRSLITLQAGSIKDKRTVRKLDDLKNRITSIGLIYKKLYSKADISHIDLKNYLHELLAELNSSLSHEKINFDIHTELVKIDVAVDIIIPIGLIITELVTNSSKYAFSGDDHNLITVTTVEEKARLTITVYDNGCGYPEKILTGKSSTLGLSLIQLLIKQLNGSITFSNRNGAHAVLEIPLK